MQSTDLLLTAAHFVNNTDLNIFLTGKAGTGKTTFLHDLCQKTYKRFAVVAPTGIAALNAKGVTIHSQFLLPLGTFIPVRDPSGSISESANVYTQNTLIRKHPLNGARKQVLRDIDLLIIDEVSMLRADVLDAIDHRLRQARRNYNQAFGGVQVLMIGDLYQLPPIVKDHEWTLLRDHYRSAYFFDAQVLQQQGFVYIELDKIFRQEDDAFIRILNNLRNNNPTTEDIEVLNGRYKPESERNQLKDIITLTTHNYRADELNRNALDALEGKSRFYRMAIDREFPESMFPVEANIELKEGAQVMFIKNDTTEGRYFNGKLATVSSLDDDQVTVIMVGEKQPYVLKKERWENRKYTIDPTTKELEEEIIGSFTQYPIKLAWAITVHKSQGLTFDRAIVDVGKAFAPGQVYVALSRLRSLSGLILGTRINPSSISSDSAVIGFSDRQTEQPPLPDLLQTGQQHYLAKLLKQTFEFSDVVNLINRIKNDKEKSIEFDDPEMRSAVTLLGERFNAETSNTEAFRNQLNRLLRNSEFDQLLERIQKGSTYYDSFLKESMKQVLKHLSDVSQFSKTKTYGEAIEEIDQAINKALLRIIHVHEIATSMIHGKEIEISKSSGELIIGYRKRLIDELNAAAAANPKSTGTKTGRKRKGLAAEKKVKATKGETYQVTLALLKVGLSIEEVAKRREMAIATIEGHLARLIGQREIDISAFLSQEASKEIAKAFAKEENKTITDVHRYLKSKFSFGQLRMVQALTSGKPEK